MIDVKMLQKQRQRAYLNEWQADEHDPAAILQDIGIEMLMRTQASLQQLMQVHRTRYFNRLPYQRIYGQTCMTCLQFQPSPSFSHTLMKKDTPLYMQGSSLLPIKVKEDIQLQHTYAKEVFFAYPNTRKILQFPMCKDIPLFTEHGNNIQRYALQFTVGNIFKRRKHAICEVYFEVSEAQLEEFLTWLVSGSVTWQIRFANELRKDWTLTLHKNHLSFHFQESFPMDEGELLFSMEVGDTQHIPALWMDGIYLRIPGASAYPDSISVQDMEENPGSFPLADAPISIFQTCYMRCDEVFTRLGAELTWRFSTGEQLYTAGKELIEDQEYHLFMRRLPRQQVVYDVYVDGVRLEYFNGEWVKLNDVHFSKDFFHQQKDSCTMHFRCPKDMLPYTYDGVESYWFRLMITKAENCYQLPSYHHIPLIQHSRWEYDYGNSRIYPKSMRTYANGESQTIENGHSFLLFPGFPVQRTSMYFLFNQKPAAGACRMFVELQHSFDCKRNIRYFIDEGAALRPLAVEDETDGFSHSGLLSMFFPSDMKETQRFGKAGYWLCVQTDGSMLNNRLLSIQPNCVYAYGDDEIQIEKEFYIQELPVDITCEEDVCEVYIQDRNDWQKCTFAADSENLQKHQIYYDEDQRIVTISRTILQERTEAARIRVKLICRRREQPQELPQGTVVFPAQSTQRIAAVHTLTSSSWHWIRETDEHLIQRLSHSQTEPAHILTLQDMERYVLDQLPDVQDVRCYAQDGEIHTFVLWTDAGFTMQSRERKQQVQGLLQKKLPDTFHKDIIVRSPETVMLDILLEIEHEDLDLDGLVKEQIKTYLHPVHGRDGKGWRIGEYCKAEELKHYTQNVFSDCTVSNCEIRGRIWKQDTVMCHVENLMENKAGIMQVGAVRILRGSKAEVHAD